MPGDSRNTFFTTENWENAREEKRKAGLGIRGYGFSDGGHPYSFLKIRVFLSDMHLRSLNPIVTR
jgi:hypothetical protein